MQQKSTLGQLGLKKGENRLYNLTDTVRQTDVELKNSNIIHRTEKLNKITEKKTVILFVYRSGTNAYMIMSVYFYVWPETIMFVSGQTDVNKQTKHCFVTLSACFTIYCI